MNVHKTDQIISDPSVALKLLKDGNKRYLEDRLSPKDDYNEKREILNTGQQPFAIVLCCSDSRVAPEIFFDQKLGDLFVIRNAGNIVDETTLGSIEYAIQHLGTRLVVICGHSNCGAVNVACGGGELTDNIKSITDRIQEARKISDSDNVDAVIRNNAKVMCSHVKSDEIINEFGVAVISAYYDIHTGEVIWI